jgi:Cys-tRNA(Pro)/Cys-tRNA(Cys) deacylase
MTPAISELKSLKTPHKVHRYTSTKKKGFGEEAARELGVDPALVFKTLVVELDGSEAVIAVIPVLDRLNMKAIRQATGSNHAQMADQTFAEQKTGYRIGGISPLGQRKKHATLVSRKALERPSIFVSAGRRGIDIELDPNDLIAICSAKVLDLTSDG